ncbi:MAG TPA: flagellar hook-basal body complex protein FliE [Verrucomicrobiae bacterium]|nr:flagellar hook-basal body complex protein FliE [Verrucomicrobiae bacterium]
MKVELLVPDTAPQTASAPVDTSGFSHALDAIGQVLGDATHAEDAYANGSGSLQDAVYRRAQADVALSVATAAAQRAAQAVQTLLNLQI